MQSNQLVIPLDKGDVTIHIRQASHYKRMSLKLKSTDQSIHLTAPVAVPQHRIIAFLNDHKSWIQDKVAKTFIKRDLTTGQIIPVLGLDTHITYTYADKPSVTLNENTLDVRGFDEIVVPGLVKDFLRGHITRYLQDTSHRFAQQLDQSFSRLIVKDTSSRWGSCSSNRALSYSWRLVFAPREVAEYVCAHEVSHLLEMNHSPRFWHHVESLMPGYKARRKWLKDNGHILFSYA